jgi:hypothetical protein
MERLETLKYAYNEQRSELDFRRRRENEIFRWSATILVVILGGLLSSPGQKVLSTTNSSMVVRVLGTLVIVGLAVFSVSWQQKVLSPSSEERADSCSNRRGNGLLSSRSRREEPLSAGVAIVGFSISNVTESTAVGLSYLCNDVVGPYGIGRALAYPSSRITMGLQRTWR